MDIIEEAESLNKSIKESKEYSQYIYALKVLRNHEHLYSQYQEFKRKNMHIQNYGGENSYDEMLLLGRDNDELIHNSIVSDFIRAEGKVQGMLSRVLEELMSGIEFDYLDN